MTVTDDFACYVSDSRSRCDTTVRDITTTNMGKAISERGS
jgi:hypothetical protein